MSEQGKISAHCLVVKFGGKSLVDAPRIIRVAEAVAKEKAKGTKIAVVVSAMGGTTDSLLETATKACKNTLCSEELDDILSMGERTSTRIFTAALKAQGVKCLYLDPADPKWSIITDAAFANAQPVTPICEKLIREHISPILEQGTVVVIPGFIGKTKDGRVTTMGRGGSDTTALILAKALAADQVILVTDVEGIMTADPKIIKEPRRIGEIDVNQLIGLADSGTKFIHQKALRYKDPSIDIKVIDYAKGDLNSEGTIIHGGLHSHSITVEKAYPSPAMMVTMVGTVISESPQILQEVFQQIRAAKVPVLGVSINHNSLILYLPENSPSELLEALHSIVVKYEQTLALALRKNLVFIKVGGVGLEETPGIVSKISQALYSEGINIFGIFTITSSVLVFVDLKHGEKAVELMQKSIGVNSN
jgi:aspartate kinase